MARKKSNLGVGPCGIKELGYVEWHEKSEELMKAGEVQAKCPRCGLLVWPFEQAQCTAYEWHAAGTPGSES